MEIISVKFCARSIHKNCVLQKIWHYVCFTAIEKSKDPTTLASRMLYAIVTQQLQGQYGLYTSALVDLEPVVIVA